MRIVNTLLDTKKVKLLGFIPWTMYMINTKYHSYCGYVSMTDWYPFKGDLDKDESHLAYLYKNKEDDNDKQTSLR